MCQWEYHPRSSSLQLSLKSRDHQIGEQCPRRSTGIPQNTVLPHTHGTETDVFMRDDYCRPIVNLKGRQVRPISQSQSDHRIAAIADHFGIDTAQISITGQHRRTQSQLPRRCTQQRLHLIFQSRREHPPAAHVLNQDRPASLDVGLDRLPLAFIQSNGMRSGQVDKRTVELA